MRQVGKWSYLISAVITLFVLNTSSQAEIIIPVSGSAAYGDAVSYDFTFGGTGRGGSVDVSSATIDAFASGCGWDGLSCSIDFWIMDLLNYGPDYWSQGDLNGRHADGLGGDFVVSFIAPVSSGSFQDATVPATFSGSITGYSCNITSQGLCGASSWPVWNINFQGTGTVDIAGNPVGVQALYGNFTGEVSYTPEPSTFVMFGSGALGFAGLLRRRATHLFRVKRNS